MNTFKKYLLISFLIAVLNVALVWIFFFPRFDHTDTPEYISTIKYFAGEPGGEVAVHRFLKPLPILIGVALTPILKAENTLIFQNLIFYFLSVWLVFLLIYRLYQNEKQALYGTILYISAYPMIAYGLASLTDLPGWFFYLSSVLISLNFLKKPQLKTAFLAGFVAGFGMLFKESVAVAPIFFASLILIATQLSFKEKIKSILVFGIAFLFFPIINSIFFYKLYNYTYFDWFRAGGIHPKNINTLYPYIVSPLRVLIEIGRVFSIGWLFVFLGILKEYLTKNVERIKIFLALLPPSISAFFFWSFPHNRVLFIAFPFLVLLGSFGILRNYRNQKLNKILELLLLFCYFLINYASLEFFLRYGALLQGRF